MSIINKNQEPKRVNELDSTNEWSELIEGLRETRLKEINEIIK